MKLGIRKVTRALLGCTLLSVLISGCISNSPESMLIVPDEITIDGSRVFPESITSDAAGTIYVGSNPGTVYRALKGEEVARPWIEPSVDNGLQSVFGVLADNERRLLWLCTNPNTLIQPTQSGVSAVKTFSLSNGALVASYKFPEDAGPSLCNDVTIASNGDAFVSDTVGARILKLPKSGSVLEYWAEAPEFAGIDGISFGPGGNLYANNIQLNTLLQIALGDNGQFGHVEVLPTSQEMSAPDGLRPLDNTRMLQSEGNAGTITILSFPEGRAVQIETIASGIDYASSMTIANGRIYYPEGKISFLFDPSKQGQDPEPFIIRSIPLPEAP